MIELGLVDRLVNTPAVAALVDTRIYPLEAPPSQTDLGTRIIYQTIDTKPKYTLSGPCGLKFVRIRLDCYGSGPTPYAASKSLANAVKKKNVLDGYSGTWTGTALIPSVQKVILLDDKDHHIPAKDPTTERGIGYVSLEFGIWYTDLNAT